MKDEENVIKMLIIQAIECELENLLNSITSKIQL